jgi:hypothetical protein
MTLYAMSLTKLQRESIKETILCIHRIYKIRSSYASLPVPGLSVCYIVPVVPGTAEDGHSLSVYSDQLSVYAHGF